MASGISSQSVVQLLTALQCSALSDSQRPRPSSGSGVFADAWLSISIGLHLLCLRGPLGRLATAGSVTMEMTPCLNLSRERFFRCRSLHADPVKLLGLLGLRPGHQGHRRSHTCRCKTRQRGFRSLPTPVKPEEPYAQPPRVGTPRPAPAASEYLRRCCARVWI